MERFVPTDSEGVQHLDDHQRAWPLPAGEEPGAVAHAALDEHPLVLLDADDLLAVLGARIFLARAIGEPVSTMADQPAPSGVRAAQLVRELDWGLEHSAGFALDCAEHAMSVLAAEGGEDELQLPDGTPLGAVIDEARSFLDRAGASSPGEAKLGLLSRMSLARRLGKERAQVAGLAMATTAIDGENDLDVLDDPRWANLAALSSALLAATEVLRHLALPRWVSTREASFDERDDTAPISAALNRPIVTPWGPIAAVGAHTPEYVPAHVSAREAAERARQAVADELGPEASEADRAFQVQRLLTLLGATL